MSKTEDLIRQNRELFELVAKLARDKMSTDPWPAYEWGKSIIDIVADGDPEVYCYGINRLVEVMDI